MIPEKRRIESSRTFLPLERQIEIFASIKDHPIRKWCVLYYEHIHHEELNTSSQQQKAPTNEQKQNLKEATVVLAVEEVPILCKHEDTRAQLRSSNHAC